MNAVESTHYEEAERLLRHLEGLSVGRYVEEAPTALAEAQVHATLALADELRAARKAMSS